MVGSCRLRQLVARSLVVARRAPTHQPGGMGVEAGITEMLERMQTGRFKVFRGQSQWMEEYRATTAAASRTEWCNPSGPRPSEVRQTRP
jgi:hypothetical protein